MEVGEIETIHNDVDHARALAEIEGLWRAEPGTAEGERLEALIDLVVAYEEAHHPVGEATPS